MQTSLGIRDREIAAWVEWLQFLLYLSALGEFVDDKNQEEAQGAREV